MNSDAEARQQCFLDVVFILQNWTVAFFPSSSYPGSPVCESTQLPGSPLKVLCSDQFSKYNFWYWWVVLGSLISWVCIVLVSLISTYTCSFSCNKGHLSVCVCVEGGLRVQSTPTPPPPMCASVYCSKAEFFALIMVWSGCNFVLSQSLWWLMHWPRS